MFKNRPRLMGFLVGLAITIAGCVAFVFYFHSFILELKALDERFLKLSTLEPDPRIVHVDIDDSALDRVGRWPWTRDKTAALIRVLHELGAKMIAVDLLIDERETPVREDPAQRDADIEEAAAITGGAAEQFVRQSDDELAAAIRDAGNVFLSVQAPGVAPNKPDPDIAQLEALFNQRADITPEQADKMLVTTDFPLPSDQIAKSLNHLRVRKLLLSEFTLNEAEVAARLGLPRADVASVLAGAKTSAAKLRVMKLLSDQPTLSFHDVRRSILADRADLRNGDTDDIVEAYRHVRSLAAVLKRCPSAPAHADQVLARVHSVEPPLFYFVEPAQGVGAVDFDPDSDGKVRSVPAIVEYEGRLIKHMGLAVACSLLGIRDDQITINSDRTITLGDPLGGNPFVIPLDSRGQMLIHWTRNAREWRQEKDFPHITAAKAWTICDAKQLIEDNLSSIARHQGEIVATATDGKDANYPKEVNRRATLQRELRASELRNSTTLHLGDGASISAADARAEIDQLTQSIAQREDQAKSTIEFSMKEIRDEEITEEEIKADKRHSEIVHAHELLTKLIPRLREANVKLEQEAEATRAELSPKIKDKIVFLGYAATALGDIVATPIDARTNGVMCHAHVLNTILSRRFIWRTPRPVEVLFVVLVGAVISFITATSGPKKALLLTVAILAAYFAISWFLYFQAMDRWIILAGPLIIFAAVWAFVTLFRQLTAEREKRIFAKQLGQYTSPVIADRLAANPEAAAAFKSVQSRDITVLFTDLAHFTTISETQDAETIQYVLNKYLERMSKVIWQRRGLINKFMGDGVMAFFNASVDPQADHARLGVEVTLDGFDEMEKIKAEEADGPYRELFAQLGMRAGIATGICKNGDFGSELKADYTVIGDVVNLAARLEPANKVFGTRLLCPASTRDRVMDHFEFRYLAELQVKGKTRTVPVYEVLGRKGTVDAAVLEYGSRFEAAVALYREQKFDDCIRAFMRILSRRPDDLGAARYIDACEELKSFPPPEGWNGALELKEK